MRTRSCLTPLYALLIAALTFAGCKQSPDPGPDADNKPRVALIMKSLANEFFVTMAEGAKAHQAAHADQYELIVNGIKNENDVAQQVRLIDQMIASGVDAIVLAPADSRALVPAVEKAQQAGIAVVNIDNKLNDDILAQAGISVPFVGPNNREGARKVGEVLARQLEPGDKVAILEGVPTAFNAKQRLQGFQDAMGAAGMDVVDVQSGYWEQGPANTVAAAMLSEHPDLKALLCSNDNMALGAAAAVRHAGREGDVMIVGYDNISAIHDMLKDGRVLATADQHAAQLAVFGIEYALQLLDGQTVPGDRETPVDLVTADSL
ncbi:MAG TPA: sugar ABC transporter substrate-binding protein [Rhodothermales bacterium]|nr:sugar ABC transporter substrate-binding protein [Rhodothermales bacterium]